MKLFQRMLVASATLGMIAPIGAQNFDINIEDMSSYSSTTEVSSNSDFQTIQPGEWTYKSIQEVAEARGCNVSLPESGLSRYDAATIINLCLGEAEVTPQERILIEEFNTELAVITARVDGLEVRMNDFEAGSFSTTTTLDGKAVFVIGAVDGIEEISTGTGAVATGYVYQMNLNTSFTGDDNLYVRLKTGDWTPDLMQTGSTYHIEGKDNNDDFKIDKIWYTFPIGDDIIAFVGPRIRNYYMNVRAAVSIYRPGALKAFKFSGNGAVFGASTDVGAGFKYEADNGFALGLNFVCKGGDKEAGCLTKEDGNKIDAMLAYTGDNCIYLLHMLKCQVVGRIQLLCYGSINSC